MKIHCGDFLSGLLTCLQFCAAYSQCIKGFESSCVWIHDEKTLLRWVFNTDYIQLSGCQFPECGTATLQGPWLPPSSQETWTNLRYKIYGTSAVYLRLYLKTDDGSGLHQVFSQAGNYAHVFPKSWTSKTVYVPPTSSRHKLILRAHTPYAEAYVAVKGINLEGNVPVTTNLEGEDEVQQEEEEQEQDVQETEEDNQIEDRYQSLEINFIGVDELKKGYTRVMDPNLCKYK